MRTLEAILITTIICILTFPFLLLLIILGLLVEIGTTFKDLLCSSDDYENAIVSDMIEIYCYKIKECYTKIRYEQ